MCYKNVPEKNIYVIFFQIVSLYPCFIQRVKVEAQRLVPASSERAAAQAARSRTLELARWEGRCGW